MAIKAKNGKSKRGGVNVLPLYIILVALVVVYALHNSLLVGIAIFVLVVVILAVEFVYSVRTEGTRKSIYDIVVALVAVAIFWEFLIIVLHTGAPVDVVASCSMLPNLQRGDIVILHGISNMSQFLESEHIPVVSVSSAAFNGMLDNMSNEFLAYYFYSVNNESQINQIARLGNVTKFDFSLYDTQCLNTYSFLGEYQDGYKCAVPAQAQQFNLIRYNYTVLNVTVGTEKENELVTQAFSINGTRINESYSNPIIVYRTTPSDYFSGDIIHRAVAAIRVGNGYYLLTKGDNNPSLDIQFSNYPINSSDVVGYVVGRIPVLGYFKLILSGQLSSVSGCNQVIAH